MEKTGVEHRHVRHIREVGARHLDADRVGRVVQWRQLGEPLDLGQHRVGDQRRRVKLGAAVHHPMPDCPDRAEVNAGLDEPAVNQAQAGGVIGYRPLRLTDLFDQSRDHRGAGPRIDHLELDRRGAGVEHQHQPGAADGH